MTPRLSPCPSSPNCVSTLAEDREHGIAPLRYRGAAAEALRRLKALVLSLPRTAVVEEREDYLHVTFTSLLLRFTDDVEFAVDDEQKIIHFRSASRVGYSDLGANRRRMEELRAQWDGA